MTYHKPGSLVTVCLAAIALSPLLMQAQTPGQKSSPPAGVINRDEQAVLQVLNEWVGALERGDVAKLKQIIPEDYLITVSDGRVLNREEDLAPIVSGNVHFLSAKTDSVRVRIFGDAAIVSGLGIFTVKMGDKTPVIRERFTDVYVRRQGRWQPVSGHSTTLRD